MLVQPRRWGRWVLLAIVVVFVFKNPTGAASLANHLWRLISQGADAISRLASALHL